MKKEREDSTDEEREHQREEIKKIVWRRRKGKTRQLTGEENGETKKAWQRGDEVESIQASEEETQQRENRRDEEMKGNQEQVKQGRRDQMKENSSDNTEEVREGSRVKARESQTEGRMKNRENTRKDKLKVGTRVMGKRQIHNI